MGATLKRRESGPLSAALVLIALAALIGCPQEEDYTPPKGGVLTVTDAEDGVLYEAEVYKYTKAVTDAEALNTVISRLAPTGTGTGLAVDGTLEIGLQKPDGEDFTSDGKFLVMLKDATDDSATLKYKAAVPFTGGSATLTYSTLETATDDADETGIPLYTVTFDLNYTGAPNPPKPQEIDEGGKATKPSPDPTREGYTFDGWYTSKDYATKWDFGKDTVTETINLYAKWTQIFYNVTFNLNYPGAPPSATEPIAHGSPVNRPADPTRAGNYIFGDWYTEANGGEEYDFSTPVAGDLQLYAKWLLPSFAVLLTEMANDAGAAAKTYTLASGTETYNGAPALNSATSPSSVTIDGGGRVVTGTQDGDGIVVSAGITLTVTNLKLHNLKFSVDGTLVLGAGVLMSGTLGGSRVSVRYGGKLEMSEGAHIAEGTYGGVALGPWGSGPTTVPPKFTMTGGTISGCYGQGGVYMLAANSEFTMTGGTISGNNTDFGGGVKMDGAGSKFYMSGGTISDNHPIHIQTSKGGGVAVRGAGSEFHMSGGTITGNSAFNGGGVNAFPNTVFEMTGGEITGNYVTADGSGGGVALDSGYTLEADGKIKGDPLIGGSDPGLERGWIHGNSGGDVLWP